MEGIAIKVFSLGGLNISKELEDLKERVRTLENRMMTVEKEIKGIKLLGDGNQKILDRILDGDEKVTGIFQRLDHLEKLMLELLDRKKSGD